MRCADGLAALASNNNHHASCSIKISTGRGVNFLAPFTAVAQSGWAPAQPQPTRKKNPGAHTRGLNTRDRAHKKKWRCGAVIKECIIIISWRRRKRRGEREMIHPSIHPAAAARRVRNKRAAAEPSRSRARKGLVSMIHHPQLMRQLSIKSRRAIFEWKHVESRTSQTRAAAAPAAAVQHLLGGWWKNKFRFLWFFFPEKSLLRIDEFPQSAL